MPGPFSKNTTAYGTYYDGNTTPIEVLNQTWWTSPKVNGKVTLKANEFSRSFKRNLSFHQSVSPLDVTVNPPLIGQGQLTSNESEITEAFVGLYNRAYGRFWSKVKGDTASLGIGIATWKQSWNMIKLANDRIYSYAHDAIVEANRRNRHGRRLKRERSADVFLEYQFGWVPALTDIRNSILALTSSAPSGWYRGSAQCQVDFPDKVVSASRREYARLARLRKTLSAKVEMDNPNVWLANKLGLVNPAQVVWDRIPWSFLVGAFANVNQVLSSFTNAYGLTVSEYSDTQRVDLTMALWISNNYPTSHPFYAEASAYALNVFKARSLGGFTTPRLQVHLPEFDMTKGLIASSLAYQQVSRLRK